MLGANAILTGSAVTLRLDAGRPPFVIGGNGGYGGTLDAAPALSITGNAIFGGVSTALRTIPIWRRCR